MKLRRFLKPLLGAGLVLGGILMLGVSSALASSSSSTTLSLSVPSSISLSGLAATYSGTAGTNINTGPVTIATNNATGYKLTLTAGAANWVGANPANLMPVSTDNLQVCNSVFASCVSGGPLTTTGTVVKTTTVATSGDVLGIVHAVAVPGSQAADTYSLSVTYLATANP